MAPVDTPERRDKSAAVVSACNNCNLQQLVSSLALPTKLSCCTQRRRCCASRPVAACLASHNGNNRNSYNVVVVVAVVVVFVVVVPFLPPLSLCASAARRDMARERAREQGSGLGCSEASLRRRRSPTVLKYQPARPAWDAACARRSSAAAIIRPTQAP
jgi:hypothetical protein